MKESTKVFQIKRNFDQTRGSEQLIKSLILAHLT